MAIVIRFGRRKAEIESAGCTDVEQVGDFVYVHNRVDGQLRVRRAEPSDSIKLPAAGVVISKQSDTECRVQFSGETPAIFSSLDIGEVYFLDDEGKITRMPPSPIGSGYSFVQSVGIATAEDRIRVFIDTTLTKKHNI